jgi:hypothetical protein
VRASLKLAGYRALLEAADRKVLALALSVVNGEPGAAARLDAAEERRGSLRRIVADLEDAVAKFSGFLNVPAEEIAVDVPPAVDVRIRALAGSEAATVSGPSPFSTPADVFDRVSADDNLSSDFGPDDEDAPR